MAKKPPPKPTKAEKNAPAPKAAPAKAAPKAAPAAAKKVDPVVAMRRALDTEIAALKARVATAQKQGVAGAALEKLKNAVRARQIQRLRLG